MILLALAAGLWTVDRNVDPVTDAVVASATLRGDNARLEFICGGGEPQLAYEPDEYLGGGISHYVLRDMLIRFDDAPASRESWKYLSEYAVAYSQKNAGALLVKMLQSKRMVMRALRYDNSTITSTFELEGTAAALHETFEACGIKP